MLLILFASIHSRLCVDNIARVMSTRAWLIVCSGRAFFDHASRTLPRASECKWTELTKDWKRQRHKKCDSRQKTRTSNKWSSSWPWTQKNNRDDSMGAVNTLAEGVSTFCHRFLLRRSCLPSASHYVFIKKSGELSSSDRRFELNW